MSMALTAPLQEPCEQLLVFARRGYVMSVLVERAQVHMAQAVSKTVEKRAALFKRRGSGAHLGSGRVRPD